MSAKTAIVVGSGFGGISAATLLARDGFEVTLLEKNEQPGGRASVWKEKGFTFDMGPSWYLMPDVFENYFSEFNKKPEDYMKLKRLDPSYRVFFSKDEVVDIPTNLEKTKEIFEGFEPGAAEKLDKYLESAKFQYDIAMRDFIYKEYKHLHNFLKPELIVKGTKLHLFDKLDSYAKRYFKSDKIRKILEYTIVFLGGTPYDSPALYSLLSHVDFDLGVWFPMGGGMGVLVNAMVKLAEEQGVTFKYNTPVEKIIVENKKAVGVKTAEGEHRADVVVINADYAYAEMNLLDEEHQSYKQKYWEKKKIAPSGLIMYLGIDKKIESLTHHNLYFQPHWEEHFADIFQHPSWPEDPSYYVSCVSKTDPSVAPKDHENMFILVPVAADLDDSEENREKYAERTLKHLEELIGENIRDHLVVKRIFTHRDFTERYNAYKGTALGLAHTLSQTAVFRPTHQSKKVKGLYYTGHYNHPGIGVPMVMISSQILSELIKKDYKM